MGDNMKKLGNVLTGQMKKTAAGAVPTTLELGVINGNLSLTTDGLKTAIPRGDYMVSIALAEKTYADGESSLPEDFRPLQAGDRVLVAWVGREPVVVAIVISS